MQNSKALGCVLRETNGFVAIVAKRGVEIRAKDKSSYPRARVVSWTTWEVLDRMGDNSFNGSIVLELGIGTYTRTKKKRTAT